VLSSTIFSDFKETTRKSLINAMQSYTGVTTFEDYSTELQNAIDNYASKIQEKFIDSATLNSDFAKGDNNTATISAAVKQLKVPSTYSAFSGASTLSADYAKQYLTDHPDFKTEFQTMYQTDTKAAWKNYFEVIFAALLTEKLDDMVALIGTDYEDKTWTMTFEKTDSGYKINKIAVS